MTTMPRYRLTDQGVVCTECGGITTDPEKRQHVLECLTGKEEAAADERNTRLKESQVEPGEVADIH
jgi:hypothetical protein